MNSYVDSLRQTVAASGAQAYGFANTVRLFTETDGYVRHDVIQHLLDRVVDVGAPFLRQMAMCTFLR